MVTTSSILVVDMEIQILIWLLLVVLNSVLGADELSYFLVGGKFDVRPPRSEIITNILWKHNDDKLAEWNNKDDLLRIYGSFEGRTTLDKFTGQLEITDMSEADLGVYSVEINWKVQDQRYVAKAIEETPQPVIWVSPVACTSAMDLCTLSCEGKTAGAEPVDYSWKMGDGEWKQATKYMIITKNETAHIRTLSCRMKNPVSEKGSAPKDNPLFLSQGSSASGAWIWITFGVILPLLILGASIAWWKKDKVKSCLYHSKGDTRADSAAGGQPSDKQAEASPLNEVNSE